MGDLIYEFSLILLSSNIIHLLIETSKIDYSHHYCNAELTSHKYCQFDTNTFLEELMLFSINLFLIGSRSKLSDRDALPPITTNLRLSNFTAPTKAIS